MTALLLARTLAGIAARTERPGPTAAQWVEALAALAAFPPEPGTYRVVALTPGGDARVTEHSTQECCP